MSMVQRLPGHSIHKESQKIWPRLSATLCDIAFIADEA